ncbi:MAG: hypothetical protein RJA55_251 [Acidobacteriota bacterium]|jgi:hypothetical protein
MNQRLMVGVSVLVIGAATLTGQAVTAQLGITEGRAREAVFDSFMAGAVSVAGNTQVFTAATPQARAAMVNAATTLARAFVESDEFKRRYADHREANGPDPLPAELTADQVLAKQRAGFEQQVEALRKQFGSDAITPEQKATLEEGFETMRAQFTAMETGPRKAELEGVLKTQRAEQLSAHAAATKAFDAVYPADPQALVALRLRAFLDGTRDIDFTARLVEQGRVRKFADAALEAKPAEWKLCFRAGKPATDAARDFASKWLADLRAQGAAAKGEGGPRGVN